MMPSALIYAVSSDDQRAAHNRALAERRLAEQTARDVTRERRRAPDAARERAEPAWLFRSRSAARPDAGGAPCRP
jgi:hypothetical protein